MKAPSEKMKRAGREIPVGWVKSNLHYHTSEGSKELTRALATMRAMLESTTDAILVTDEVTVTDFNEKYIDMWKVPLEDLEAGAARKVRQFMSQHFEEPRRFLPRIEEVILTAKTASISWN